MLEETIYSDNNVSVTTARIIIGGTTYALRNIASVKMAMTPSEFKGCAGVSIVFGIIMLVIGIGMLTQGETFWLWLLGLVVSSGGWVWLKNCKAQYHVAISSASGETHALTSKDQDYITKVVSAINEAIVKCG